MGIKPNSFFFRKRVKKIIHQPIIINITMEVFGLKIIEGLNQVYTNNIKPASHKELSNVKKTTMPVKTDKIELSSLSKEMNRYIELSKSSGGDSPEKIARIKNEINNGTYKVSTHQLASILVDRLK